MPKNHAKAIKGLSIACIAIAGLVILICLAVLGMMGFFGPIIEEAIMDSYTYDYGYGYGYDYDSIFGAYGLTSALEPVHGHGYASYYPNAYDELGEFQMAMTMLNVLMVLGLIAEGVVLAAGIIVLKNHNKPEKFGMIFVWSIIGAIIGFFAAGIVQGVLFIIIAVFINSDKKLYQAGMYFVPVPGMPGAVSAYVPQQPVPPMAPNAPGAPAAPVAQAPAQPMQGVQAAPVAQPAQPIQPAQPAAAAPQAAQPAQAVTTAEIFQPAGQPLPASSDTQPPAPVEAVAVEMVASTEVADAAATEAIVSTEAADVVAAEEAVSETATGEVAAVEMAQAEVAAAPETAAPVIVDGGAVIKLDVSGDQPSEK